MIYKKNKTYNYKLLIFLTALIPIFIISGPFLTDLSISLLALAFIIFIRENKYFYNYYTVFCLLFYLVILLSSSTAEHKFLSYQSSLFYFRFFCFSLMFWFLIEKNSDLLKYLFYVLIFCFLALILDSFLQYLTGTNAFNMKILEKNRISSFFGDELKMGGFLTRIFPLLLGLSFFFFKENKHKKYLKYSIVFIFLTYVTIFLSGERTSFFLFNFSIILFLIFINDFNFQKLIFFVFYIILTVFLLSSENPFKKRIIDLTVKQINKNNYDNKGIYIFSEQYNQHYKSSWLMFKDNKIIGIGPKNFREICKKKKYNFSVLTCSTHPHNTYIQLLAETGLIGFLIIFSLNLFIWYLLFKSLIYKIIYKEKVLSNFQISLLIYIVVILWPFAPSGSFFNNWNSAVYYLPVGIILWSFRYNRNLYLNKKLKKNIYKI